MKEENKVLKKIFLTKLKEEESIESEIASFSNRIVSEVSKDVTKKVIDSVLSDLDRRCIAILQRAELLAENNQIAIGIQINESPIKYLKDEAHPLLSEIISFIKVSKQTGRTDCPLLVGPAGCGKTQLADQLAEALELPFYHINLTAGASETWLFGRQTALGYVEGNFSKAYKEGGVFLADELDAADANLLLCINTALANKNLYNPINGESIRMHDNFTFIGAANTVGKGANSQYTGRTRLDSATLDRFVIFRVDYLERIENKLLEDKELRKALRHARKKSNEWESQEVVSYRAFTKASTLYASGKTKKEVMETIGTAWPKELLKEAVSALQ